jgi:DNA-binding transcriptional LysR family regulator
VELRHLRYFVAVAEELHFSRAAARLYVAQPAVSEQVRNLEKELGVRLFDRTPHVVSLTRAGAALLDEARRVLRQAEIAQTAARDAAQRSAHQLRLGHLPELLPSSVARAMWMLGAGDAPMHIRLETGPALRLIGELRARQLDAVIVGLPIPANGLRITRIGAARAVAALPAGHPYASSRCVALRRLAPERIIVLPRESNPAFHTAIVAMCRDAGLSPDLVETGEARADHAVLAVAAGAGMALLPESAAERHLVPGVRFVALDHTEPAFESAILTLPGASHELAVARFLHAVAQACRPVPADVSAARLAA